MASNREQVERIADTLVDRKEMHGDEVVDLLNSSASSDRSSTSWMTERGRRCERRTPAGKRQRRPHSRRPDHRLPRRRPSAAAASVARGSPHSLRFLAVTAALVGHRARRDRRRDRDRGRRSTRRVRRPSGPRGHPHPGVAGERDIANARRSAVSGDLGKPAGGGDGSRFSATPGTGTQGQRCAALKRQECCLC